MSKLKYIIISASIALSACNQNTKTVTDDHGHDHEAAVEETIGLTLAQVESLGLTSTKITNRNMAEAVEVSGSLEVPPQNEALVTAIVGANIKSINVIEGQEVKRDQVLATLTHPDLLNIQTEYISALSELEYEEASYNRQKKLHEEKVSSGKQMQLAKAEYLAQQGQVKGLEYQLKLLGLNPASIAKGNLVESVPVKSPINGFVQKVNVKTAQFVMPEREMFEIINLHHIHADIMVFEKDVNKVHEGQKIRFYTEAVDKEMTAEIYSVGKSFEENPKAVHVHAEIENKEGFLLPGMYIKGQILVSNNVSSVLPSDAVVRSGDDYLAFQILEQNETEWIFKPIKVNVGLEVDGYYELHLNADIGLFNFVANKAYYILSEYKKDEAGHGHSH